MKKINDLIEDIQLNAKGGCHPCVYLFGWTAEGQGNAMLNWNCRNGISSPYGRLPLNSLKEWFMLY
jgi:hypothetical protein